MTTPQGPHSVLPILPPEVAAARAEDPEFAEVMARARAKARERPYTPERDYPYRGRRGDDAKPEEYEPTSDGVDELLERWSKRGERRNPYLRIER